MTAPARPGGYARGVCPCCKRTLTLMKGGALRRHYPAGTSLHATYCPGSWLRPLVPVPVPVLSKP